MAAAAPPLEEKRETVRVVVRVRPLSESEAAVGHVSAIEVDRSLARLTLLDAAAGADGGGGANAAAAPASGGGGGERSFSFDAVFDDTSTQREVYEDTAMAVVNAVLQGYNGTVFAYGQTGTGKTYTMEGGGAGAGAGGGGGGNGNGGAVGGGANNGDPLQQGIIPAALDHIFGAIQASEGTT